MDESERVYLIAAFDDGRKVADVVRTLGVPRERVAVLGREQTGALMVADEMNLASELDPAVGLAEGQERRLEWFLENDQRPLLAVEVLAEQGRDLRLKLTEMGGEMIDAPQVSSQANDVDWDLGMEADEPERPPNHDRIYFPNPSDNRD